MGNKVYIETLGCAKNSIDSQIMMGQLMVDGYELTSDPEKSDVLIVNTCGFVTASVNESIDRILDLSEIKNRGLPRALIVVGCLSERYRDSLLEEMPEIDAVLGTSDYTEITGCIHACLNSEQQINMLKQRPIYSLNNRRNDQILQENKGYAYLKISEGCSNMCAFCNIPKLRGPFRSRAISDIRQEMLALLDLGVKEVNLISQDSSSYGRDLRDGSGLVELVRQLLSACSSDFWLRIFYTYPNRYPGELFRLMGEDQRLVPYADIPFQHVDDSVLKSMNRRISGDEIETLVESALRTMPDLALRTTFIVGYPNETRAAFRILKQFVEKGYFTHLGIFAYSAEDNIASAKLGDPVSEEEKNERRDQLMEIQQQISLKKNQSKIGQKQKVLVEGAYEETDLLLKGRNQCQGPEVDGVVLINEGTGKPGLFHQVEIIEAHPYDLVGRICEDP